MDGPIAPRPAHPVSRTLVSDSNKTVVLVDNQRTAQETYQRVLEPCSQLGCSLVLCEESDDLDQQIASRVNGDYPAVVLIGVGVLKRLPVARLILKRYPAVQIIFLSGSKDPEELQQEMSPMALIGTHWGILPEDGLLEALEHAVRSTSQRLKLQRTLAQMNARLSSAGVQESSRVRKLLVSDRYLASILEHAHDAIFSLDDRGIVTTWNQGAERTFGINEESVIGKTLDEAGLLQDRQVIQELLAELRKQSDPPKATVVRRLDCFKADGKTITVEMTLAPVFDDSGTQIGISTIGRDITERESMQQQLRQHEKLAALGQLVGGVAHELNNPLTAVIGYTELMLSSLDLDQKLNSQLGIVLREADRMRRIILNLLSFSRQREPDPERIDINNLIESVLADRSDSFEARKIKVKRELQDLPELNADPNQIRLVLQNIINNAEQAMENSASRKVLKVKTERIERDDKEWIRITLADTGPGVAPEIQDQIFNPFFTTRSIGKGTGLGLSVSYGIVTAHGGSLVLDRQTRRGATFLIYLPIKIDRSPAGRIFVR